MSDLIFNIGLNRAGTTSLAEALNMLGYRTVHHKYQDVRLYDIIMDNVHMHRRLFHGVDSQYDAFSDFAGQYFYSTLDEQYPNSKFILTTRELNSWLDSRERKVHMNNANPDYRYFFRKVDRDGWQRERAEYLGYVNAHFRDRDSDLLVMDIPGGEGWESLCSFLDCPIPDIPFPCLNRSTT